MVLNMMVNEVIAPAFRRLGTLVGATVATWAMAQGVEVDANAISGAVEALGALFTGLAIDLLNSRRNRKRLIATGGRG